MKRITPYATSLLACSALLAGCAGDVAPENNGAGKVDGNGGPDLTISEHEDGYQQATVDASQSEWIYIDLETFSQVFPDDPNADDVWDLAFEAAAIKTNGSVSGAPPTAEQVYIYADKVADAVVAGRSAEPLLDQMSNLPPASDQEATQGKVQNKADGKAAQRGQRKGADEAVDERVGHRANGQIEPL